MSDEARLGEGSASTAAREADDRGPFYLAIDLGPTRLIAGVVDATGEVVVRDRLATPARSVWPALTQLVKRVLAAKPESIAPTSVGVTCPGPIDRLTGAMKPVGMPTWHDFPIRRELATITGLPVFLDTAGRGLARGELWRGESAELPPGEQHFAVLSIGDEVDGGLVVAGRLLEGLTNNLGQFGHLIVEPDGAMCRCGASGCLAAYAGTQAIAAVTGRELRRTPLAQIETVGIMVARACASIAAMFDVDQIVIGGVVARTLGDPFFTALGRELEQRSGLAHLAVLHVRSVTPEVGPLTAAAAVARAAVPDGGPGEGTTDLPPVAAVTVTAITDDHDGQVPD